MKIYRFVIASLVLRQELYCDAFMTPQQERNAQKLTNLDHQIGTLVNKGSSPFHPQESQDGVIHPNSFPEISNPPAIARRAGIRKKWGVDKDFENEYWFNDQIHTLGNTGFFGGLHAAIAPLATKLIDVTAYKGIDIRELVAKDLAATLSVSKARVLDLCCGVGMSTRALQKAFPDAAAVIGVDTSPEMISMARAMTFHHSYLGPVTDFFQTHFVDMRQSLRKQTVAMRKTYDRAARKVIATFTHGNAEQTPFPEKSFDLITIMYAFHEAPAKGRDRILREVHRLLHKGGTLALIDISPEYNPSPYMLKGEPYVLEYQANIDQQLRSIKGFTLAVYKTIVPGHVGMWILKSL